jgi:hypothetical protein
MSFNIIPNIIPCIKDKCLKYPACRHKKSIKCEALICYYYELYHEITEVKRYHRDIWNIMNEILPNLDNIRRNTE